MDSGGIMPVVHFPEAYGMWKPVSARWSGRNTVPGPSMIRVNAFYTDNVTPIGKWSEGYSSDGQS
jgi:hypothetical protein